MSDKKILKWARRWAKAERALRLINDQDAAVKDTFFASMVTEEERRAVSSRCDYTEQRLLEAVENAQ